MHSNRIQELENIISQNPNDKFALYALAKEYESIENIQKSIQILENLLIVDKYYIGAYYHLAKNFEKIGEIKKALNIYEIGITIAIEQQQLHALSELKNAKMNLELEL